MLFAVNIRQGEIGRFERMQAIAMRLGRFAEEPHRMRVVVRDGLSEMARECSEVERPICTHE